MVHIGSFWSTPIEFTRESCSHSTFIIFLLFSLYFPKYEKWPRRSNILLHSTGLRTSIILISEAMVQHC